MSKIFFEIILGKSFTREAIKVLSKKKNLKLIDISKFKYKKTYQIKTFDGSFLLQEKHIILFP